MPEEDSVKGILLPYVQPWYDSIENPKKAQDQVLADLLPKYAETEYGQSHSAHKIRGISEYQSNFPIINYSALIPHLNAVRERSYKAFLSEPPQTWVMTRGSTGHSKVLPATQTHLKQIYSCGARAIINHALKNTTTKFS
ncbi:MAG: GH3 auxin-responsive promoter family protein [Candidatus Bathyarchaeota archaeon]|nr:GH3 auxin-responsive promoter family protein [Candidatus Bathyarchaeota archaeon]